MTIRQEYEFLRVCLTSGVDEQSEFIKHKKREIRKYLKEPKQELLRGTISVDDEYPSYIERIELPDWIESKDEAKEWMDV